MIKRLFLISLILMICLTSFGCWDYTSMNQMNIVLGVAIDKDAQTGEYLVTYEAVDMTKVARDEISSVLFEARGNSIFDSARNAKRMLANKLYFGNIEIIIVSHQIAEEENGLREVIDLFLRGTEARETIEVAVSQEKTAAEIFKTEPISTNFISTKLSEIITEDARTTSKTRFFQLIRISEILASDGDQLVLPAVQSVVNDEEPTVQTNGTAAFKDGRLIGYLTPDETKFYLYVVDEIEGGLLVFQTEGDITVTMEIHKNKTRTSVDLENGRFKATINPKTRVFISELSGRVNLINEAVKDRVEADAEAFLYANINAIIDKAQNKLQSDIFGFGSMVYRKDPKLWNEAKKDWDSYFQSMEIEISPEVEIVNTALRNQ